MNYNQRLIDEYLKKNNFHYMREPFKKLLINGNIPMNGYNKVRKEIKARRPSEEILNRLKTYFEKYNISYTEKVYKYEDKTINERQKKYREKLKEENIKTIKINLKKEILEKIKRRCIKENITRNDFFEKLLKNI